MIPLESLNGNVQVELSQEKLNWICHGVELRTPVLNVSPWPTTYHKLFSHLICKIRSQGYHVKLFQSGGVLSMIRNHLALQSHSHNSPIFGECQTLLCPCQENMLFKTIPTKPSKRNHSFNFNLIKVKNLGRNSSLGWEKEKTSGRIIA